MKQLPEYSQENVLTLLCFDEGEDFAFVRGAITVELFLNPHLRVVAKKVIDYIDQYRAPPRDHIRDLLDLEILGKDGTRYQDILKALFETRYSINRKYVLDSLRGFIRRNKLEGAVIEAAHLINEGKHEEAHNLFKDLYNTEISLFEPGLRLSDIGRGLATDEAENPLPTGLQELDKRGLGPAVGQFLLFAAPKKGGKSWWNVHLGTRSAIVDKYVCHITLELTEKQTFKRYLQSILSISQRHSDFAYQIAEFTKNERGILLDVVQRNITRPSYEDDDIYEYIKQKATSPALHQILDKIIIKGFPTGSLSVDELRTYLQGLERTLGIVPNLVVIDHADYMKLGGSIKEYRLNLQELYIKLRGLAIERNFALTSASQINREGDKSKNATSVNLAESYGKAGIVDTVLVYNQTDMERADHIARLLVADSRVAEDKFTVLVSQNYSIGQFCLGDALLPKGYDSNKRFVAPQATT